MENEAMQLIRKEDVTVTKDGQHLMLFNMKPLGASKLVKVPLGVRMKPWVTPAAVMAEGKVDVEPGGSKVTKCPEGRGCWAKADKTKLIANPTWANSKRIFIASSGG
jgi:hypothetical protein